MAVLTTTPQEQADLALERQLAEQAAHVHAGTARLVALLSEYDRSGCWEGPGIRSVEHRAGIDLGLDPATARRYVILARGLRDRPVVAEACAAGRLSPAKAELVVRACDPDPASQTHWVDVATAATPTQLARIVRAWDTVRDDPAPAATAHRRRSLRIAGADEAGMVRLTALLPAEDAAVVRAALDAHAEAAWREHQGDPVGDPAVDADDPGAARLADALVALAETGLAAGPTPCVGGDRHAVTIHVHAGAVSGIDPTTPDGPDAPARRGRCHLRDGTPLDASAARRMACEAAVRPLFENALRQPLDLGRTRRVVTTAQRRLVETRDGGCASRAAPTPATSTSTTSSTGSTAGRPTSPTSSPCADTTTGPTTTAPTAWWPPPSAGRDRPSPPPTGHPSPRPHHHPGPMPCSAPPTRQASTTAPPPPATVAPPSVTSAS